MRSGQLAHRTGASTGPLRHYERLGLLRFYRPPSTLRRSTISANSTESWQTAHTSCYVEGGKEWEDAGEWDGILQCSSRLCRSAGRENQSWPAAFCRDRKSTRLNSSHLGI